MAMTDPIADMLTRIRNANSAYHEKVEIPASKMKAAVLDILKEEGFVKNYESVKELIFAPLRFEEEMKLRGLLASHPFDLSPIFIVDEYDKSASYKIELRFRTEYSSLEV